MENNKNKMIDGVLHIYCEENGEYYPKFKTDAQGTRYELDEKYFIYVLEGDTVDNSLKVDEEVRELEAYDLSIYYGIARERFLKSERKELYIDLIFRGSLRKHLVEIDMQANEMEDRLVEQYAQLEGVTDELKMNNQMEWVGRMNNIIHRVREVVQNELIYV